jgi:hypothetical protein
LLYAEQGKLKEAKEMYSLALEGYEEALGSGHVRTYQPALRTMFQMGQLLARLKQKGRAVEVYA